MCNNLQIVSHVSSPNESFSHTQQQTERLLEVISKQSPINTENFDEEEANIPDEEGDFDLKGNKTS